MGMTYKGTLVLSLTWIFTLTFCSMLVGEEENLEQVGVTGVQSGILSGLFIDQDKSPIVNHQVNLFYDYSTTVLKPTVTDANGKFKFDSLFPGTYAIEVDHLGKKQRVPKLIVDAGEHNKVELIAGKATTYQRYNNYNQPIPNFTALKNNSGLVSADNQGTFFDGQSMIYIPTQNHYNVKEYEPYTFESKIKPDTTQLTFPTILSSREEEDYLGATLIFLFDKAGVPALGLGNQNLCVYTLEEAPIIPSDSLGFTTSPNLRDNQWHHIVMTRDSNNWKLYVDNVLVCEDKVNVALDLSASITIGGDRASRYNTYFHGYIKDLKIWTSYTDNIEEFSNRNINGNEPDLLAFWPLDSSLANPLIDYSSNQNHGFWSE